MVGGSVIEVRPMKAHGSGRDVIRLWCLDATNGGRDECAVYTAPADKLPAVGDQVWWQGGFIYWTPAGRHEERKLPKIGNSFDPRSDPNA